MVQSGVIVHTQLTSKSICPPTIYPYTRVRVSASVFVWARFIHTSHTPSHAHNTARANTHTQHRKTQTHTQNAGKSYHPTPYDRGKAATVGVLPKHCSLIAKRACTHTHTHTHPSLRLGRGSRLRIQGRVRVFEFMLGPGLGVRIRTRLRIIQTGEWSRFGLGFAFTNTRA